MSRDSLGYEIDDSAIFHRAPYDPAKARAYYLANRKLKGRKKGSSSSGGSDYGQKQSRQAIAALGGKPNRAKTKSRQAELKAQKEALSKRLDRLRDVLAEAVAAAKKRSGGDPNKEKDKAPETPADKADRNAAEKKAKPETASEKKERAKKAKEEYEKENPTSLSQDIDVLQEQIEDIQGKIQDALSRAQDRRSKAGKHTSKSGSKNDNDGPRGR